jgi:hypothetical protein
LWTIIHMPSEIEKETAEQTAREKQRERSKKTGGKLEHTLVNTEE